MSKITKRVPNFRVLNLQSCYSIIKKHHYSRRIPASVQLCYGDIDYGPPRKVMACCIFSNATGRWEDELWELTRLVRMPSYKYPPLTKLVSKSLGHIRRHNLTNLIVSFADLEEDHHGGIYQACSWLYDGVRGNRLDGFNIDGEFVPARTCNSVYGTSSISELIKKLPDNEIVPHFDIGKFCYWKSLSKLGMKKAVQLGLKSSSYPKPMIERGDGENRKTLPGHIGKGRIELSGSRDVIVRHAKRVNTGTILKFVNKNSPHVEG